MAFSLKVAVLESDPIALPSLCHRFIEHPGPASSVNRYLKKINKMEFGKIDNRIKELNSNEIIGIDGCDGSGKTHLSKEISEKLKCTVLNLDDFVEKDKGNYVENLKISAMAPKLSWILQKIHFWTTNNPPARAGSTGL